MAGSGSTKTSPVGTIDRQNRTGGDDRARVTQPGHGGHVDRARENGAVIGPAARVGDEPRQPSAIELRDHRRRELVGNEHSGPSRSLNSSQRVAAGAEVHSQAADDVADVALPLAQIGVFGLIEERGNLVERALERRARVQPLGRE